MRHLLFCIILLSGCSSVDLMADREALDHVKAVAIISLNSEIPFNSEKEITQNVFEETETVLSRILTRLGYRVDETKQIKNAVNNKLFFDEKVPGSLKKMDLPAGSDAVLMYEILRNETKTKIIQPNMIYFYRKDEPDKRDHEVKYQTLYRFHIAVKIIRIADCKILLTAENRVKEAEHDDYLPGYVSLDAYRKYTLEKFADELVEKLKKQKD